MDHQHAGGLCFYIKKVVNFLAFLFDSFTLVILTFASVSSLCTSSSLSGSSSGGASIVLPNCLEKLLEFEGNAEYIAFFNT